MSKLLSIFSCTDICLLTSYDKVVALLGTPHIFLFDAPFSIVYVPSKVGLPLSNVTLKSFRSRSSISHAWFPTAVASHGNAVILITNPTPSGPRPAPTNNLSP